MTHDLEALFEAGQFQEVITAAQAKACTPRELALLGIAYRRLGQLPEAEGPLHRASVRGDQEAQVELGNVLRLLGRNEDACAHFETIHAQLDGELAWRCLRWWGVAEFQSGNSEAGLKKCERAWHGYVSSGDDEMSARVAQSVAQMHSFMGNHARARLLLNEALHLLPDSADPMPRLGALRNLADVHLALGALEEAKSVLRQARKVLLRVESPRYEALVLTSEAEVLRLSGKTALYGQALEELAPLVERVQDNILRLWVTTRLAEYHSAGGLHGRAVEVLLGYGQEQADWPAELWAACGILERRRGEFGRAERSLEHAAQLFQAAKRVPELVRVRLHQADARLRLGQEGGAATLLNEAMTQLLRLKQLHALRPDLEELSELLQYAYLEPDLAPYMEPVLDNLAYLAGTPKLPEDSAMRLSLQTLGRLAVFRDGEEVALPNKRALLLLTYIAMNPGHTRAEMELALFPDVDPQSAGTYVRQAIKDLRGHLGPDVVTHVGPSRGPRYHLGPLVRLDLDLTAFKEAIDANEMARALALYRGPFLPGIESGDWVLQQRDEALLALTFQLHAQLAHYRDEGDHRRVVLFANLILRADPHDREVLEARVAAARQVAGIRPQDLARYVAEQNRAWN